MAESKRIYNLDITKIHPRKLKYKSLPKIDDLPPMVDLRSKMPPIYNQGNLGSCTANVLACCLDYEDKNSFPLSRLFIYYNERVLENDVNHDSGATLSSGIKTLETYGACPESMWPYIISKFKDKPTEECYEAALKNRALEVTNIPQDLTSMKLSLANDNPFVVGIAVYQSFESHKVSTTGIVSMPDVKKERLLGGHAIMIVGYDDTKQCWIARNSWGESWGDKGYFYLPYLYLLDSNLSGDLWNIIRVS